jgi:hypothetical protein
MRLPRRATESWWAPRWSVAQALPRTTSGLPTAPRRSRLSRRAATGFRRRDSEPDDRSRSATRSVSTGTQWSPDGPLVRGLSRRLRGCNGNTTEAATSASRFRIWVCDRAGLVRWKLRDDSFTARVPRLRRDGLQLLSGTSPGPPSRLVPGISGTSSPLSRRGHGYMDAHRVGHMRWRLRRH